MALVSGDAWVMGEPTWSDIGCSRIPGVEFPTFRNFRN